MAKAYASLFGIIGVTCDSEREFRTGMRALTDAGLVFTALPEVNALQFDLGNQDEGPGLSIQRLQTYLDVMLEISEGQTTSAAEALAELKERVAKASEAGG